MMAVVPNSSIYKRPFLANKTLDDSANAYLPECITHCDWLCKQPLSTAHKCLT